MGWPLLGVTCAVVRRDPRVSESYGWPNTSDLYQVLSSSLRQVAPSTSRDRYEVRRSRFGPDGFTSGPFEAGAFSEDGAFHLRSSCVPRSASSSGYRCRDVCCAMFRACIVHAMQAELQHAQGTTQASGVARARRFSRCFVSSCAAEETQEAELQQLREEVWCFRWEESRAQRSYRSQLWRRRKRSFLGKNSFSGDLVLCQEAKAAASLGSEGNRLGPAFDKHQRRRLPASAPANSASAAAAASAPSMPSDSTPSTARSAVAAVASLRGAPPPPPPKARHTG